MLQLSPPPSTDEHACESSSFSALLDLHPSLSSLNTPSVLSEFWVDGMEELLDSNQVVFESSAATFHGVQVDNVHGDDGRRSNNTVARTLASSPIHISALQEREVELMMQFLCEDFSKLYPCYRCSSMTENAWLMWLLQRSPTFLYAALGTTAYFKLLNTPSHDGRRTEYFREYDRFRNRAIELYCELLAANSGGCTRSTGWVAKETLISGVQLAMLELLNENFDATLTYLNSASDALARFSEELWLINGLSQVDPASNAQPSGMEHRSVEFFTAILIWVHVLHCLSCKSIPAAASLYRRILSTSFGETFFHVVGLEGWAHVALMDAINTAIWKRDQDLKKMLSMRELVGKSDAILSAIEHQIQ
ncbi:hypothetical protein NQ176_g3967 [Zarea fungicola]|uniref:Uncharacterized protein n=1 Tax=Zarea fungicola TaxID=93591 RepID=A0ACC1NFT0_9HYPO|nr:hypothetical protein NQ176_g3967 [Lecanicillium fungicola]